MALSYGLTLRRMPFFRRKLVLAKRLLLEIPEV
jgi:hypothetical protein